MGVTLGRALILAVWAAGCGPEGTFECSSDAQCLDGGDQGRCEPNGFCSFPDPTCPSGRRFGDLAGGLANMCVPELFDTDDPTSSSSPPSTESDPTSSTTMPGSSTMSGGDLTTTEASTTAVDGSTGPPCDEFCLDYQPQWQLPIQNSFTDLARLPDGRLLLVGGYVGEVAVGAFELPVASDADLYMAWLDGEDVQEVLTHNSTGSTYVLGLSVDPSGDIYVSGHYMGSPDFGGPALPDAAGGGYVVSFDGSGAHRWTVPMPGGRTWDVDHYGNSLLAVGDFPSNVTIGATTLMTAGGNDGYLVRLHQDDGNVILVHHVAGAGFDLASDAVVTGAGFVATGAFSETWTGGDTVNVVGTVDGWVQRLTSAAIPEWTRSFGGGSIEWPFVDADAAGNLYLIAMFEGTLSFDDGTSHDSTVSDDIIIAKLGPDGAHEWSYAIPSAGASRSWEVDANADGRVVFGFSYASATTVAGQDFVSAGANDGIVVMYDTDGTPQWVTTYSGPLDETGCALMLEDNGDLTGVLTYQSASIDVGLGPAPGPSDGMNYAGLLVHYPAP